jgi:N-acetylglucosaminyl-diphospho-decaprenol L-rhamnosyltransferase|tara:strand:+ start:1515 stop:2381 length:867 start_codon:yes stop_codon:yes gene_type:complete
MNLSVVIVTFKSDHLIEELINSVPDSINILVVENSLSIEIKNKLEKKYKNVEVYLPKENLGYASAINYGVKNSKTNFVMCLVADVEIDKSVFIEFSKLISKFNDFAVLAPLYNDLKIYKNYWPIDGKEIKKINLYNNSAFEVKDVDGAAFLVNKKKFKNKIMDDNFFLYFENTDMCFNLKKEKQKIYIIETLKFNHLGTKSSDKKFYYEINLSRNWHYCWSKFYFYKKNFSYLLALKKISPNIYRSLLTIIICLVKIDKKGLCLAFSELSGIFYSLLGKKSSYRAKIP